MGICSFLYEYSGANEERRQHVVMVAAVAFMFFFGFRGYIYSDWILYTDTFRNVQWSDLLKFDITDKELREPGFTLLCLLCKTLINEYVFLNVVCAAIYLVLLIRFCRQFGVGNIPLVLMLFIAMDGTVIVVNLLRNSISIGIRIIIPSL